VDVDVDGGCGCVKNVGVFSSAGEPA